MVKKFFPAIAVVLFLSSCSTFKPLNFTSNKPVAMTGANESQSKFIDDISVTAQVDAPKTEVRAIPIRSKGGVKSVAGSKPKDDLKILAEIVENPSSEIEAASPIQLKYAVLMNTEVESLPHQSLLKAVDDWYGVRYLRGGTSHSGIDCSGFTSAVYEAAFGLTLPRVSRDQYKSSRKISITELKEGDLVFFNTNGSGVSHVGVYLGNNKFMHASVSRGVMVSGLFESYYQKRYVGAGRYDEKELINP